MPSCSCKYQGNRDENCENLLKMRHDDAMNCSDGGARNSADYRLAKQLLEHAPVRANGSIFVNEFIDC